MRPRRYFSRHVLVVIAWQFDSQLPVQSVPIVTKVGSSKPAHGELYTIQPYLIKIGSDLRQVGGFHRVLRFHPPDQTDHHDIAEIWMKVTLTTIAPSPFSTSSPVE